MLKHLSNAVTARPIAVTLAAALLILSAWAGPTEAMLLPAMPDAAGRATDLAKVQRVLEMKEVQQRLQDHGLTPDEALARLNGLSDEQLHQFAANADALQPGGDALGTLLGLVLIALLVVLIIYLLEGRISVQHR